MPNLLVLRLSDQIRLPSCVLCQPAKPKVRSSPATHRLLSHRSTLTSCHSSAKKAVQCRARPTSGGTVGVTIAKIDDLMLVVQTDEILPFPPWLGRLLNRIDDLFVKMHPNPQRGGVQARRQEHLHPLAESRLLQQVRHYQQRMPLDHPLKSIDESVHLSKGLSLLVICLKQLVQWCW